MLRASNDSSPCAISILLTVLSEPWTIDLLHE